MNWIDRSIARLTTLLVPAVCVCAASAAPRPEPMRLVVSPERRTWSLQERVGAATRTLLRDARVRVVRADGSEVTWRAMRRAADGRSFTLEAPDLSVKVLAQWLDPQRLPATVSLLPIVYAKRAGVRLREVDVTSGAALPTISPNAVAYEHGYQASAPTTVRPVPPDAPVTSWWLTALHSGRHSLVAGYLSNVLGANALLVSREAGGLSLGSRSDLRRMDVPRVADGTPLDALYLSWGKSPSDMLAEYAAGARVFTNIMDPAPAFTPQPIPGGWGSWHAFSGDVTEEQVVRNAEALRRAFGTRDARLVQVDDGFQIAAGEWETNAKFPHGHRWLTDAIHARGFKAGVWIAPFAVGENSRLFREHPDWLLKGADGQPLTRGDNPRWGGTVYVLDPSLQPVRAWLRDLGRTATQTWGYDTIKLDFLFHPMLEGGVMGGNMTPAQAYRAALKAFRLGAGKEAYLLGGGAPIGPTIGLVNGNRIGPDVNAAWPDVVEAARDVAYRQWMHNVWWQNDPDTLNLAPTLTDDQARAWTAAVALSGGLPLLGNDLASLPPERLALAHMALPVAANGDAPPFGSRLRQAVRATGMRLSDMWAAKGPAAPAPGGAEKLGDPPGIWRLPSAVSPARITVVGLFNWGENAKPMTVTPSVLADLPRGRRAHVWDVWEAKYLGVTTGTMRLVLAPTSSRLLSIAPDVGYPQLLGTDAHVTSGGESVLGVKWDTKYRVLRGKSRVRPGVPFRIAFSEPKGLSAFRLDAPGARVERLPSEPGSSLFRLTPETSVLAWTVRYTKG